MPANSLYVTQVYRAKQPAGKLMKKPKTLLRDIFGFDEFRPGQREIIDAVSSKKNVLAIMPTGGGKSLCFQLPALMSEGLTVVISPLIALMRDQVRGLQAAGVAAGALTSGNTEDETDSVFSEIYAGTLKYFMWRLNAWPQARCNQHYFGSMSHLWW